MQRDIERMMLHNVSDEEIEKALTGAGWSASSARAGIASFHRTAHGPVAKPNVRAKQIAHGVAVLLLIALVAWQSASLTFGMIDRWVSDPSEIHPNAYWRYGLAWPAANLLVLCPILFFYLRRFGSAPDWAKTAGSLLVAAILIGDAVTVLHGLLSGGAGARFLLKCFATAVIAGLSFQALRGGHDA